MFSMVITARPSVSRAGERAERCERAECF